MQRSKLPFRKNCEGYFILDGKVLAKDNGHFIGFPGGGVDENEDFADALIRETFEETGAVVKNLKQVGELKFIWGENWAKTEKQKKRFENFQGEDMRFFTGEIEKFGEPEEKEEDFWEGEKLIPIDEVISKIKEGEPFDDEIKDYRLLQIKILRRLVKSK